MEKASATLQGAFLRASVTHAALHYVGSVTIHASVCEACLLADNQQVVGCNERTGRTWTTYVIKAPHDSGLPLNVFSINGTSADYVRVGDPVTLSSPATVSAEQLRTFKPAPALDIVGKGLTAGMPLLRPVPLPMEGLRVGLCYAKVHRPRVTAVKVGGFSADGVGEAAGIVETQVAIDAGWLEDIGLSEYSEVLVSNVTTKARIFASVRKAARGSRSVEMYLNGTTNSGYNEGDVVIIMAYGTCDWRALLERKVEPIRVAFPYEKPVFHHDEAKTKVKELDESGINIEQIKEDTPGVNGASRFIKQTC